MTLIRKYNRAPPLTEAERQEALRILFGLSPSHIYSFCKSQLDYDLKSLIATESNPEAKYIPQLYHRREEFHTPFNEFLLSDKTVFALVGDSGSGKTCSLCHAALELHRRKTPVLFFKGALLAGALLEAIVDEFAWTLAEHRPGIQIIQKIQYLFENQPFVIIVDAIDEWPFAEKVLHLASLAQHLLQTNIKLLLSCKSSGWPTFLRVRDEPTSLADCTYLGSDGRPGCRLPPPAERDYYCMFKAYREYYEFQGGIDEKLYAHMRSNLFFLRICFEAAQNSNLEHLTNESREIYDQYYKRLLRKSGDENEAARTLSELARALFEKNQDTIETRELRQRFGLSIKEKLLPSLFEYQVLDRGIENAKESIAFYFQQLRDYLIVFHVLRWHEMEDRDLRDAIGSLSTEGIHPELLCFFYRHAEDSQRLAIDGPLRPKARECLDIFSTILTKHFPDTREVFLSGNCKRIGFAATAFFHYNEVFFFGFRCLNDKESQNIVFVPMVNLDDPASVYDLYRVRTTSGISLQTDFRKVEARKLVTDHIEEVLSEQIKAGQLDESLCPELHHELAIAVCQEQRLLWPPRKNDRRFPVDLNEALDLLRERALYDHFERVRLEERLREGSIGEWNESGYSYSTEDLTWEDREWALRKTEEAFRNNEEVDPNLSTRRLEMEKTRRYLETARQVLSTPVIKQPLFPALEHLQRWGKFHRRVPNQELAHFIKQLYTMYFRTYKTMIERNFPSLKHRFKLYASMPLRMLIVPFTQASRRPLEDRIFRLYYFKGAKQAAENTIEIGEDFGKTRMHSDRWLMQRADWLWRSSWAVSRLTNNRSDTLVAKYGL